MRYNPNEYIAEVMSGAMMSVNHVLNEGFSLYPGYDEMVCIDVVVRDQTVALLQQLPLSQILKPFVVSPDQLPGQPGDDRGDDVDQSEYHIDLLFTVDDFNFEAAVRVGDDADEHLIYGVHEHSDQPFQSHV
ncbi:hypothetical protein QJS10_CPB14g00934 [Acorus calamus]|uniref:Uncharacterized protein n=1 Tax=Acorus calamus TaxID=4465 RepID=A0AAV9DE02_ACOCL|nr:hypothetical protein QJS10_CPB14g00934 [Acorus calamus]